MADQFKYTNNLIKNEIIKYSNNWQFIDIYTKMLDVDGRPNKLFFDGDGLHLSAAGYKLWAEIVRNQIMLNS